MMTRLPWEQPVVVQQLDNGIFVAREDLCEGGSKVRFLPTLCKGADHIVYAGPFCGGAALALSVVGKYEKKQITLFYAQRKTWHPRQLLAQKNGATLIGVPMGFISHVNKRATDFAMEHGALKLTIGFDQPEATAAYLGMMHEVRRLHGDFDAIYCACSSGMLTYCLARAFPSSEIVATGIGLKKHREHKRALHGIPHNITIIEWPTTLEKPCTIAVPFSCCPYYERKAWATLMEREQPPTVRRVLFWNVLGDVGDAA